MNCIRLLLGSLSVLTFASASACDSQTKEQSSSSTHWVTCETDDDCAAHPSHPACEAGYCVNTSGERLPVSPASGGRASVPELTGGNAAVGGGGSPASTSGGAAASGNSGSAAGSGGSVAAGSGGDAGSATEGGASSSGQAGAGGVDCGCLKGGQAPVCGIDGRNYDAICGDECVPVAIACRGQCPCPTGTGGNGGNGGSGGNAGSGGSGIEPGSACSGQEPYARPDLDKTCEATSDCFAGRHLVDCCGTTRWVAYSEAARADFEQAELGCTASCPCPLSPTLTEDGMEIGIDEEAVPECIDGTCMARHPDAVGECLDPGECIDTDSRSCIVANGPVGNGACRGAGGLCYLCKCASPDTPIATPKGYVAISELRAGDLVYSVDGAAIRAVPLAMIHRNPVKDHEVVEVRLESGATLAVSASHPIADGRTFGDLSAGASLGDTRIASVRRIPYAHPFTHDILPDSDTGTYFAAGVRLGSTLRIGPALTPGDR
jgi:hypothetical protein